MSLSQGKNRQLTKSKIKQQRLVEAWAELHQGGLMENWERLQSGQFPYKITPLK